MIIIIKNVDFLKLYVSNLRTNENYNVEFETESKKQPFDIPKSNRSKGRAKGQAVPFSSFKQPKPNNIIKYKL